MAHIEIEADGIQELSKLGEELIQAIKQVDEIRQKIAKVEIKLKTAKKVD